MREYLVDFADIGMMERVVQNLLINAINTPLKWCNQRFSNQENLELIFNK
jgi:hypothetical protein